MAIVVEDGSIVAGANSYLSLAEVRAFALARGVTLSATDSVVEVQLVKAADYIEARDKLFQGCRVSDEQVLCWPRDGIYRVQSDQVPPKIAQAQAFLVMAQAGPAAINVLPVGTAIDPFPTKKKKLGPLEKEFQIPVGASVATWPRVPAAEEGLAYYYKSAGSRLEAY